MTAGVGPPVERAGIVRRSVHDAADAVVGYELLFTGPRPGGAEDPTSEVIATAFGDFGLHRFGHRRHLYVNLTRPFLVGALPMPFGPLNVVIEVLGRLGLVADDELVEGALRLKSQGYRLAVDAFVAGPLQAELLPLVDLVKLDVGSFAGNEGEVADLAHQVHEVVPRARLLAEGVPDAAALDACREAGFELFTGPHFEPAAGPAPGVNPAQSTSLRLLATLSDPAGSVEAVERILAADPGLSLRVLSTINSAAGSGRAVESLRQAIVLLGRRTLSAWAMLAVLGGHPAGRREDLIRILTRARSCELLTPLLEGVPSTATYTVGLLSGLVETMGTDPVRAAREARLDPDLTAALVEHRGPVGELLEAVEGYDRTSAESSFVATPVLARAHLQALGLAVTTIDGIFGDDPA
jgi:c-di-GMP-related signal transduction protein